MRNPEGYSIITDPAFARPIEHDTTSCGHCNAISFTQVKGGKPQVLIFQNDGNHVMRDVPFCRNCFRFICPRCEGKECYPFEKYLDKVEGEAQRRFICL